MKQKEHSRGEVTESPNKYNIKESKQEVDQIVQINKNFLSLMIVFPTPLNLRHWRYRVCPLCNSPNPTTAHILKLEWMPGGT